MTGRLALLAMVTSFAWAARSFLPDAPTDSALLLTLGFLLLGAHLAGAVVATVGLPKLTGYLALGIAVGPSALGLVSEAMVDRLQLVNGVATALIALTAGGELNLRRMRPLARAIGWVTLIAVVGTALLLAGALFALRPWLPFLEALDLPAAAAVTAVLGVMLAAQSPAVVIAVRAELEADGPVTRLVLGVVIVADLVVIVLFALTSALGRAAIEGHVDLSRMALGVGWEIFGSLGAGVGVGAVLVLYLGRVRGSASLFLVAVCIAVAEVGGRLHLDPLITALTAGVVVENASDSGHRLLADIVAASLPLYLVFFAVAGAALHLDALRGTGALCLALVGVRALGLVGGSRVALHVSGADANARRHVGFGLLPQAGLAIALTQVFARSFPGLAGEVSALALGVVAINELVAPVFFRRALLRAGEAKGTSVVEGPVEGASAST